MKARITITAAIAILAMTWAAGSALAADDNTVHLYPTDDSYIDSAHQSSNYGASLNTYVGDRANQLDGTCMSFYQFDMSEVPSNAEILNAELWLYAHEKYGAFQQNLTIGAHLVSTPGWNEMAITYDARPGYATTASTTATQWFEPGWAVWNVTVDVASERPSRTQIGWGLKMNPVMPWVWVNFYTSEHVPLPDYRPMLEITYSTVVADEATSWSKVKSLFR